MVDEALIVYDEYVANGDKDERESKDEKSDSISMENRSTECKSHNINIESNTNNSKETQNTNVDSKTNVVKEAKSNDDQTLPWWAKCPWDSWDPPAHVQLKKRVIVCLSRIPNAGRGIFATENIKAGDDIFIIQKPIIMSVSLQILL